jgi:hypothetical protein
VATDRSSRSRRAVATAGSIGVAVLVLSLLIWWWSRPPQMGADEEVFKTVDALFTAITARDEKLLADCGQRLLALRDAGKLPPDASAYIDNISRKARVGQWDSAAHTLYDFIRAQRREGSDHHHSRKEQHPDSGER